MHAGKVRSIGVSNFTRDNIEEVLHTANIPPAVNEIEAHPYLQQPALMEYLKQKNILVVAYSPRGNPFYSAPPVVEDPTVQEIATRLEKNPYQLLLSWAVQRGTAVLAKSVNPEHIETNFQGWLGPDSETCKTD